VTSKPENMTDSNPTQTQHSYRLIDANGEVLDQTDLPTFWGVGTALGRWFLCRGQA
jgi:hypothetical protein